MYRKMINKAVKNFKIFGKTAINKVESEKSLHTSCIRWLELQHRNNLYWNHSPNENPAIPKILNSPQYYNILSQVKSSYMLYNKTMKLHGRQKGHPDLEIFGNNGRVLLVEFKSHTGKIATEQQEVSQALETKGHKVHIVRSLDEFMDIVNCFI